MKKAISIFLLLSFVFLSSNCATLFKGTTDEVNFASDPQAAEVFVNGQSMGQTPIALTLKVNKSYTIEFRKEGYKSQTYTINNTIGAGWVILDVLTGLIGVIVDAATGAWYSLDQENVNAVLQKQQP